MPILTSKLEFPSTVRNLVPRPQLMERLDAGLGGSLILISAPAGFGKTTLLSSWAGDLVKRALPTRVGWVSLDSDDTDLSVFLTYLLGAACVGSGQADLGILPAIRSPMPIDARAVLTALLNALAQSPDRLVLVLDDYHLVASQPINEAVGFLVEHLPAQVCLAIGTRADPDLPLSRLRARGQMVEIREADLRLDARETALFLSSALDLALTPKEYDALNKRTEGWVTGLKLAALGMQGLSTRTQVASFVRGFGASHRYVIDYLVDEVLSKQPSATQMFLMQTSILSRLSAPLANAVTGRTDSQDLLGDLERANLFLVPLDTDRGWYRYHRLFADLLQQRMGQDPDLCRMLYRRASAWCEQMGLAAETIQYALDGGDADRAADLIEQHAAVTIDQGAFATVREWIAALPSAVADSRPMLHVHLAWVANLTHRLDHVQWHLADAARALGRVDEDLPRARAATANGHILTIRAWDARRRRDSQKAVELASQALVCLDEKSPWARAFALLNLGLAQMDQGQLILAAESLSQILARQGENANGLAHMLGTAQLAAVYILQGQLSRAEKLCRQSLEAQQKEHGVIPATACLILIRLGWVLAERGDVEGFMQLSADAVVLADRIGYHSLVRSASWMMAWEAQLLDEQGYDVGIPESVVQIVDRVVAQGITAAHTSGPVQAVADSEQSQIDNTRVYLGDDAYFDVFPGLGRLAQARSLVTDHRIAEALDLLAEIEKESLAVDGLGLVIEARITRALLYYDEGELEIALEALESAMRLSDDLGYVRSYADRGRPMARLLCHALKRGTRQVYVTKLLTALGDHAPAARAGQTSTPSIHCPIEPLSPRETQVLRLIAEGKSNRQICDELFLALSTVKGHNQRIYGKLQVRRRTEAVAKARRLGLI